MCTHRGGAAALGIPSASQIVAQIQAEIDAEQAAFDAARNAAAQQAAAIAAAPLSAAAQALITQLQATQPDRIKYAMARSSTADLFRDSADIQTDLAKVIGVSSGDIRSWRIMSTPDNNGYVTAEATIDQTTRSWNGGRNMGTGAPTIRTRTTTRYETGRVRIIRNTAE